MSGSTTPQVAIAITGNDAAFSKTIARVNQQLAGLTQNAGKLGSSTSKLGATDSLSRLTQGMHAFGVETQSAFGAMEKLVPAVGLLTGAATLGGMALMVRSWANMGTQVANTAYRLQVPIDRLEGMHLAAQRVNVSADSLDASLRSLQQHQVDSLFNKDPQAQQAFEMLNISLGTRDHIRDISEVYGELLDKIKAKPVAEQKAWLDRFGITQDTLPMVKGASKAIDDAVKAHKDFGALTTPKMVEDNAAFTKSLADMNDAVGGLGKRFSDDLMPALTRYMDEVTQSISQNQKWYDDLVKVGATLAAIATSLSTIGGLAWVLEKLGFVRTAATIGAIPDIAAAAVVAAGVQDWWNHPWGNVASQSQEDAITGHDQLEKQAQTINLMGYFGAGFRNPWGGGGGGGGDEPVVPKPGTEAYNVMMRGREFWAKHGYTPEQTAGIFAGGEAAESGFNPSALGDNGTSYGLYQEHAGNFADLRKWAGTWWPTEDNQRQYFEEQLRPGGKFEELGRRIRASHDPVEVARLVTLMKENPANALAKSFTRSRAAPYFVQHPSAPTTDETDVAPGGYRPGAGPRAMDSNVHVTVHLKGDVPPGTTAHVTSTGPVTTSQPIIEFPLGPR